MGNRSIYCSLGHDVWQFFHVHMRVYGSFKMVLMWMRVGLRFQVINRPFLPYPTLELYTWVTSRHHCGSSTPRCQLLSVYRPKTATARLSQVQMYLCLCHCNGPTMSASQLSNSCKILNQAAIQTSMQTVVLCLYVDNLQIGLMIVPCKVDLFLYTLVTLASPCVLPSSGSCCSSVLKPSRECDLATD